jgi:hypothetical protein
MEKSLQYMSEVGGKVAWVNLICNAWLGNRETTVYWVKKPEGGYAYDFRVFDRYMDLVQKHLKLEAACVYVFHPPYPPTPTPKGRVSVLDAATGKVDTMETPVYTPTPEAVEFWKPVLAEVSARLKKRGLPEALNLAMVVEGGGNNMSNVVAVFKGACPDAKWVNLAHYGGQKGNIHGAPYGYVMSVWGNYTPHKSKEWAAADLPLIILQHFRADPVIDLRPISSRGSQFWATERAIGGMRGIGPLGADFWNLTAEEGGWKGGARALENYVTNLNMNHFTTAAYLAPGPDGPISTARFEIFRHGVQMAEVRTFLQKALGKPETRQRLGDALAKRCEEVIRDRSDRAMQYVGAGERFAQGEGWKWFETSDWQELDGKLFDCAEEAAKALAAK